MSQIHNLCRQSHNTYNVIWRQLRVSFHLLHGSYVSAQLRLTQFLMFGTWNCVVFLKTAVGACFLQAVTFISNSAVRPCCHIEQKQKQKQNFCFCFGFLSVVVFSNKKHLHSNVCQHLKYCPFVIVSPNLEMVLLRCFLPMIKWNSWN